MGGGGFVLVWLYGHLTLVTQDVKYRGAEVPCLDVKHLTQTLKFFLKTQNEAPKGRNLMNLSLLI